MTRFARLTRPIAIRFRPRPINHVPSPVLAQSIPWLSIMFASLLPNMPVIASAPVLPPFGLLMMLAWRQVRPGVLPVWAGLPLGFFDDLFSGQPFGSAILLWSLAMIGLDAIEARFPWRSYWLDWLVSAGLICGCQLLGLAFANAAGGSATIAVVIPQLVTAILLFPLSGRLVSALDRLRLMPIVELD
ncbi:MAG: rod shape-determining protein MreD [Novosphingobium sp.]